MRERDLDEVYGIKEYKGYDILRVGCLPCRHGFYDYVKDCRMIEVFGRDYGIGYYWYNGGMVLKLR